MGTGAPAKLSEAVELSSLVAFAPSQNRTLRTMQLCRNEQTSRGRCRSLENHGGKATVLPCVDTFAEEAGDAGYAFAITGPP
jgi:hypothetical protein